MKLCALDFETTGLDFVKDRVTEVGAILYSTENNRTIETAGYFVQSDVSISKDVSDLTGITNEMVSRFGLGSKDSLIKLICMIDRADAIAGQNVVRFDKLFLEAWCKREEMTCPTKLWIDTRTDLGIEGKHLQYMCADEGWLNLMPHNAVADCQSVLKLISSRNIDDVVALAKQPTVVLLALTSFEEKDLAKKRKYAWNPKFKVWWKGMKESQVAKEANEAPFDVKISDIPLDQLWYDK